MASYKKALFGNQTITNASDENSAEQGQVGAANIFGGAPRQPRPTQMGFRRNFAEMQNAGQARPAPAQIAGPPEIKDNDDEEELLRLIRQQLAQSEAVAGADAAPAPTTAALTTAAPMTATPMATAAGSGGASLAEQVSASLSDPTAPPLVTDQPPPAAAPVGASLANQVSASLASSGSGFADPSPVTPDVTPDTSLDVASDLSLDAAPDDDLPPLALSYDTADVQAAVDQLVGTAGIPIEQYGDLSTKSPDAIRAVTMIMKEIRDGKYEAGLASPITIVRDTARRYFLRSLDSGNAVTSYATQAEWDSAWTRYVEGKKATDAQAAKDKVFNTNRGHAINRGFDVNGLGDVSLNGGIVGNINDPDYLAKLLAMPITGPRKYTEPSGSVSNTNTNVNDGLEAQIAAAIASVKGSSNTNTGTGTATTGTATTGSTATGTAQAGLYSALEKKVMDALNSPGRYDDATIAKLRTQQRSELDEDFAEKLRQQEEYIAQRGLSSSTIGLNKRSMLQGQQARAVAQMETDLMTRVADSMAQDKQNAVANALGLRGQMSSENQFERTMGMSERQFQAESDRFAQNFGLDKVKFAEASKQFRMTLDQNAQQFGVQQAFNEKTFNQQASQFAQNFGLDTAKFAASQREFQQSLLQNANQFNASQAQNASQFASGQTQNAYQFGQTYLQNQQQIGNQQAQWQADSDQRNRAMLINILGQLGPDLSDDEKRGIYKLFGIDYKPTSTRSGGGSGSGGGTYVNGVFVPNSDPGGRE